jgi:hypothetical protein
MATNYTSLLGFALPTTGELAGTWGQVVNDSITQLVEDSVAGTATVSVTAGDVTLTTTGSGAANQARCAIIIATGTPGTARNIIAPSQSKAYIVINQSDSNVTFKGAATSGHVLKPGEANLLAWNGSDYLDIEQGDVAGPSSATDNAVVRFDGTSGKLVQNSAVTIADTSGDIQTSGSIIVGDGTASLPSITNVGDTNTGIFFPAENEIGFAVNGNEELRITSAGYTRPVAYGDTVVAIGNTGTAATIDLQTGNVFTATLTGNCTFTLSNPIATGASSFTLILTNDATPSRTVAFAGGTFRYPDGSVTRTTTANATDIWFFFTPNGGTTWYGSIPMKNLS